MKKLVALLLVVSLMACMFAACGQKAPDAPAESGNKVKVGIVLVGDENEGYTEAEYNILQNYFAGVENTGRNIAALADKPEALEQAAELMLSSTGFWKEAPEQMPLILDVIE